jgi:hypothetical protein
MCHVSLRKLQERALLGCVSTKVYTQTHTHTHTNTHTLRPQTGPIKRVLSRPLSHQVNWFECMSLARNCLCISVCVCACVCVCARAHVCVPDDQACVVTAA